MCGIFGYIKNKNSSKDAKKIISSLFLLSESRGKEASGMAYLTKNAINVLKTPTPASKLVKTNKYREAFQENLNQSAIIGHARLVTNGDLKKNNNNQPVIKNGIVGIHNGIIVNDENIWNIHSDLLREYSVDTELILALISKFSTENNLVKVISNTFKFIEGTASIALFFNNSDYLVLATNNGSLYFAQDDNGFYFASEENILLLLQKKLKLNFSILNITKLKPNEAIFINTKNLNDFKKINFLHSDDNFKFIDTKLNRNINNILTYENTDNKTPKKIINNLSFDKLNNIYKENLEKLKYTKRCTKCILPETMPFIQFDNKGVCNYCNSYQKMKIKGMDDLKQYADSFRRSDGKPDCLVALSGGRDSSYGLHIIKNELNLNPIAYSYDWGMLTDLGRRNQSRMCGSLGVEHILISANIPKKRSFIKKNVLAWLKKPNLGTIPLFMAGDKQYFYYLNKLKKNLNLKLTVYAENPLEKTDFKSGFCGVAPKFDIDHVYDFGTLDKIKLANFYLKYYIINPSLINSSVLDTVGAYIYSYFISHNYLYLFSYLKWDEDQINTTLINKYNWEMATDTKTTWRIGDGTAAFYNYIYFTVAGFTENDTFRSNQIREGVLSREKALELSRRDNAPRYESLNWYADTVNFNLEKAINIINKIPKLYVK